MSLGRQIGSSQEDTFPSQHHACSLPLEISRRLWHIPISSSHLQGFFIYLLIQLTSPRTKCITWWCSATQLQKQLVGLEMANHTKMWFMGKVRMAAQRNGMQPSYAVRAWSVA
jgi:hypothetical protein